MKIAKKLEKKRRTALLSIAVAAYILLEQEEPSAKRRWWVRPWLQEREKGNLNLVNKEFENDPGQFKTFLRMDERCFGILMNMVEERLAKQDTLKRQAITTRDKLLITLRFLATGETYRSLMYSFRVAESTISLFIPVVCRAIYETLVDKYMKVPQTAAEWLNIAKKFNEVWNMPNMLGALDGKHVVFRAPQSAGSTYYNYKNQHSIVLLALVSYDYKFLYVDVGTNGRVSDGGVFQQSSLATAMAHNTLNFPEDKCLPGRSKEMPYVMVADAAFPLSERILKPYPFRNMTQEQRIFNYRLSRARRVVENAFGILANRFRIFLTIINLSPEKVQDITLCCCVLHNFLRTECPIFVGAEERFDSDFTFKYALSHHGSNRPKNYATEVREEFKDYVNGVGAVGWQEDVN